MKLEADLVAFNGNIITMDPKKPRATALAAKSYKFLAVGDEETVEDLVTSAKRVIDLGGKTVVPGFIDAHTHLTSSGVKSFHIDLSGAKSVKEAMQTVREAVPNYEPGHWIKGYSWDESLWSKRRYINNKDLDKISKEHPIALTRIDGHLVSVNSMGLEKLKVPLDHEGVEKDSKGRPTGILKDMEKVFKKLRAKGEEVRKGVEAGNKIARECGITSAVDNVPEKFLPEIRECERRSKLTTRMILNLPVSQMKHLIALGFSSGMGSPLVRIGGVKIFTDGSIGARTAAISEDYSDEKGNKGMLLYKERKYTRTIKRAIAHSIQTVTHAIGDVAIDMVLNAFEKVKDPSKIRKQRHRLEHVELITDSQIRRAVSLGLILSMQPNFVGQWQMEGGIYYDRLGEDRALNMNPFRATLDNGSRLCFGSDGMPYGPIYGIWCAVNHPSSKGRLTIEEALRCYTLEAAYASYMDRTLGSITEGKRADFVVLSDDILSVSPKKLHELTVDMTIVGGIVEYSAPKA